MNAMATDRYKLADSPDPERARELWLQHAAGFILFEDMRRYASERIDPNLSPEVRAAVQRGIDDAVYGLMMIIDGVTGALSNATERVELRVVARHVCTQADGDESVITELDLAEGDGMCMGFHGWKDGDFGSSPVSTPSSE
jgi:hypothetical protein